MVYLPGIIGVVNLTLEGGPIFRDISKAKQRMCRERERRVVRGGTASVRFACSRLASLNGSRISTLACKRCLPKHLGVGGASEAHSGWEDRVPIERAYALSKGPHRCRGGGKRWGVMEAIAARKTWERKLSGKFCVV